MTDAPPASVATPGEPAARDAPTRVLVVDDEAAITELVAAALRHERLDVRTAACGADTLVEARRFDPELVVLDLMLPDMDGFDVFRRVARPRDVPCILLTARDSPADTVRGLTLGADDHITKPFSLEDLVARIRTVLRRAGGHDGGRRRLAVGGLQLDDDARIVTFAGTRVELTPTEFTLLRHLMQNAGRVLSKQQILDHVWAYDFGGQANIVEIYVSYLRRKPSPMGTPPIATVRGFGYVLRPAEG